MEIIELFNHIVSYATEQEFPDIHITTGTYPIIRDHSGDITEITKIHTKDSQEIELHKLEKKEIMKIIGFLLGPSKLEVFINTFEIDGSYQHESGSRYRINCYYDTNGFSVAMRLIPEEIPKLDDLGLGERVKAMCKRSKGLILVTGPTGVGKSTNLAGMIDFINSNYRKHIITIEDPIEFVFKNKKSLINQREIGIHTRSFSSAIKSCLREDPDVIMIGEMRDPETIKAAITLAETGHLVFSTLHTNDTVQTIDRIIDVFPAGQQEQIRMQLAMSLIGIVSQRLLPRAGGSDRIAAREVLLNNDAVRNLVISGKTNQLYSVIEIGQKQGMILLDHYLEVLYKKGLISKETFLSHVRDKENVHILEEE